MNNTETNKSPEAAPKLGLAHGSAPWVAVEDQKPKTGQKVIVCGSWSNGNPWISVARWQPAGTIDTSTWDEVPDDWQDEDGEATNPTDEWMEEAIESETSWSLPRVSHWMPLPSLPNAQAEPRGGL